VVILGCTHYPLIAPLLQRQLGRDVTLVNPAAEVAREVAEVLARQDIENDAEREGDYRFYCTGEVASFRTVGARFLQMPLDDVEQVSLERLAALVGHDHQTARPR
jgi:glutamate racemase